jgi:repressor LexA
MGITKKQSEVLKFVKDFISDNGYAPSYREIASGVGLSSPSTAYGHVQMLFSKGLLCSCGEGKARSIEMKFQQSNQAPMFFLPLVGIITAGEPIEALEENETMAVPSDFVLDADNSYILRVKGRSMIEDGIFDGDYVVIERNPSPRNGEVVVALLDNAYATLKRFYREKDRVRLQPANSTMDPIMVKGNVNIQGIVRAVIRKFQPA